MELSASRILSVAETDFTISQGDDWLDVLSLFDEQQLITIGGSPTGGTSRLNFRGYWTSVIAYNASAAAVRSALEAVHTIRAGKVTVTGSNGGPYTVAFDDTLQAQAPIPLLVADGSRLTPSGSIDVALKPVDLTGFTARMMIREKITDVDPVATFTTENGRLVITALEGKIAFNVPASISAAWTWRNGVYDLEIVSAGSVVQKILRGNIVLVPEVTR